LSNSSEDSGAIRVVTLPLNLPADEVHVWLAKLTEYSADSLIPLLAADELSRAARFHFDRDRNKFIVARAWLRKLLAAYLDVNAGDLQFVYGEKGKPRLEGSRPKSINFNLAHSHELAIYAFSQRHELGVDLEFVRADLAGEEIAERFFSEREVETLRNVPADLRKQAFFDCWTRKEAYIKARGEGLSMPLDEFDVSLAPGEAAALLRNDKEPGEVARWSMQSVNVPAGYAGAVVVSGQDWTLKMFDVGRVSGL
jgi:4'-phosphopantetheinyl transferase